MDIRHNLQLLLNTLLSLRIDGKDGNWSKLLGMYNLLQQMIQTLDEEVKNTDAVREMGDN